MSGVSNREAHLGNARRDRWTVNGRAKAIASIDTRSMPTWRTAGKRHQLATTK